MDGERILPKVQNGSSERLPVNRPAWARFGVALACVLLAWGARGALTPAVGPTALPFIFFFPAVAAAAWWGGLAPGIVAVALAALASDWSFMRPDTLSMSAYDAVALAAFVSSCAIIVGAIEATHRSRARLAREIGERRRAEAEIGEALERLATTLASIGDGVIVTDDAGRVVSINGEAERLTGWPASEAAGRPLADVFRIAHEKSREPAENPVATALREGRTVALANHTLLLARDGREVPIDDSAAPVRRPGGPVLGAVLVFRDVTAQRKAHDASARLASIVESSGDAIWTKGLDGTIRTWNRGAEKLFGYRSAEVIGRRVTALLPPELEAEETEILDRLQKGQRSERLETVRVAKDGRRLIVSLSVSPLLDADGCVTGASSIVHDVTDVVAAREALAREKELLATTLASIGDGVIVTDTQGKVTFLNPEAAELTGWLSEDACGLPLPQVFRIVNEQTRAIVENPVDKVLRFGGTVGLANHTVLIAKDGSERAIDDSAAPIRVPGIGLSGVVLVFRDVTERRRAEAVLREEDRRKDEFLAILSHELRNPLAPIGMAVDMLRKVGPPDPQLQELRDIIDRQAKQLSRLLDDLLDVGRIASGKISLRKARISLGLALSSAVEAVRPAVRARRHELIVDTLAEPIYLEGDLGRLAQVFTNLLHNAVKYTEDEGRITVGVEREGSDVLVRVCDTGIGLTPEQTSRIFDMFAQVDRSLERVQQGLGVGLALSRRLVELHGGRIEARSAGIGRGSEFTVRLPISVPTDRDVEVLETPSPDGQTALRVLIADDNEDSVTTLSWSLSHAGHDVRTASDGLEAVEAAIAFRPRLAILDIGMPRLNGYEAARRIREALGSSVRLVAVTGWGQDDDKRRAHEAGFDRHVTKPIDMATLKRIISEVRTADSMPSGG